ncbi:MAG: excinuclease ABC subunit UvrC [Acholeplasmataceae bacterium]
MDFKDKLSILPQEPGCYLMKNDAGVVIYVGKAKQLKNRVKSYFTGAHNEKTTKLVSEIRDFSYVLTNSEQESLILELNLIKQYQPKYNIRLTDDKTYPYIEITSEKNPKLQVVRKRLVKGRIFGPYPNAYSARETVRLLNRLYPLRKCDTLPKKACLYYHIGQCLAPCIKKEPIDYTPIIDEITRFLKGDTKEVLHKLETHMADASLNMQYEKAIEYRDMMNHINQTTEKQIINLNDQKDRDMIGFAYDDEDLAIEILMMRQGKLIDHHQSVFAYILDPIEALIIYLKQYYESHMPDEVLVKQVTDLTPFYDVFSNKISIPKIGDKKKLVDLASKNALENLTHYRMLYRHKQEKNNQSHDALNQLLGKPIDTIEVFDNAQLFGTAPISAMIVYQNQQFDKKQYRKYHIKTTTNDDYQAMREVIYRRYQKKLMQQDVMPDLILVDGGKGHLRAAYETLESLGLDIMIAGIKKNKLHQLEALVIKDQIIDLKAHPLVFKLLLSLSEEVHRFAIDFHRKTRNKQSKASLFDDIPGIGEKRKKALLKAFKDLETMKNADDESFIKLGIPKHLIPKIKEALQ